jgi:hypothetical protein
MKFTILLAAACFAVCPLRGQEAKAEFPKAGFSIVPLDIAPGKSPSQLVATFFLPAEGGFAPNVNVLIFSGHENVKGFIDLTRKEFEQMKATIVSEKQPDAQTWVVEYRAQQNAMNIRFYAKAQMKGRHLHMATATCLEDKWDKLSAALKACVDSLNAQ